MALLEVEDVHAYYGNIQALKGISLQVDQGEIVTLIGANGAGKTTMLKVISGLLEPRLGSVHFREQDITGQKPHEIVNNGVAMVPEGRGIFSKLSVMENLELGAYSRKDKSAVQEDLEWIFELFPRLKERRNQTGGTLSGGEQQMLATARALMAKPALLLMDEPSMGLAPVLVESVFASLENINQSGTTILLVEQNAHMALQVAGRGYVIQSGEIALSDSAQALKDNKMVRKVYLGIE
jgi:branched-chain amino acid transport system ATP-binding protein